MPTKPFAATGAALLATALLLGASHPAAALTMKECGAKYQDAKKAGTLNGQDWNAYRAANCATTPASTAATPAAAPAKAAPPAPATATAPAAAVPPPAASPAVMPAEKTTAAAPAAPTGNAVFPAKVDPKYASLKAGKARMKTCDDQYKVNKAGGGNGGLKWIQKGGGYFSECNKRLKGA